MNRREAIEIIAQKTINQPTISANGYISRDLFEIGDKPTNFYMIGSMGLSSSIGLGIALKNPQKHVFILDGDGNILMNLGSLITIGALKPKNLVHIILDNESHESTGGQPTNTRHVHLAEIGKAANYTVFTTKSKTVLKDILDKISGRRGPIMILVKIDKNAKVGGRVKLTPKKIRDRFMESFMIQHKYTTAKKNENMS